jgi:DNA-binding transcriptional ArsR family regulator
MDTRLRHPLPDEVVGLIAQRFAVLAEPMRIKILDHLRERDEASVQEIAAGVNASHANVSRHLNVLHRAEIVGRRKVGTTAQYHISDAAVFRLCEEVCGGLTERHRRLGAVLDPNPQEAAA